MNLIPAYGRDYKKRSAVEAALLANQDFLIRDMSSRYDGKPTNKADLMRAGITSVTVRFDNLRKVAVFPVPPTA